MTSHNPADKPQPAPDSGGEHCYLCGQASTEWPFCIRDWCPMSDDPQPAGEAVRAWQPIETAPRDGKTVLAWADNEEDGWQIMTVKWTDAQTDPKSLYVEHDAGWCGRIMFPGYMSDEENPVSPTFTITHWMPLPEAPTD